MKHGKKGKAPSQRQLRVGEQIRHMLAETLQRGHFHDELLMDYAPQVTVSEVRVTPNLKQAKAFVTALGGRNQEEMVEALNEAASYFQKEINRQAKLKFTPKVHFVTDTSFDEAEKIDRILKNL